MYVENSIRSSVYVYHRQEKLNEDPEFREIVDPNLWGSVEKLSMMPRSQDSGAVYQGAPGIMDHDPAIAGIVSSVLCREKRKESNMLM